MPAAVAKCAVDRCPVFFSTPPPAVLCLSNGLSRRAQSCGVAKRLIAVTRVPWVQQGKLRIRHKQPAKAAAHGTGPVLTNRVSAAEGCVTEAPRSNPARPLARRHDHLDARRSRKQPDTCACSRVTIRTTWGLFKPTQCNYRRIVRMASASCAFFCSNTNAREQNVRKRGQRETGKA
eukprot:COSAG02_NODE_3232_length_7136_cov_264.805741_3_plen_177_part_00